MEIIKDRDWRLSFTCGMMGVDFDDMDLSDYTKNELEYIDSQLNNARLDISRELRQRGDNG